MKSKQNFKPELNETYQRLQNHTERINFLRETVTRLQEDSFIAADIESGFIENGYAELLQEIKTSSKDVILKLLHKKIQSEEEILDDIIRILQNEKDKN